MSMSATDVAAMSIDEVRRELDETRAQKARLAAREIALVARLESLVSDPNAPIRVITEFELVSHGGLTMREAREAVARSRTVAIAPAIGAALSAGITTAAHVDVLSRGLKNAGPDRDAFISHLPDLTLAATTLSAVEFSDTIKKCSTPVAPMTACHASNASAVAPTCVPGWTPTACSICGANSIRSPARRSPPSSSAPRSVSSIPAMQSITSMSHPVSNPTITFEPSPSLPPSIRLPPPKLAQGSHVPK